MSDFPELEPLDEGEASEQSVGDSSRRASLLAAGLLLFCLLTAVGNWVYGIQNKETETNEGETGFSSSMFQESPDIGIIRVDGPIMHGGGDSPFGAANASSERIVKEIRKAEKDGVKGILVKINSPGGTAAASHAIYSELMRLRQDGVKVVATMGDVAASGGYYIAAGADQIFANPSTLTGSIGVIAQFTKIQGLYEKLGLKATVIKSGKHKDIGSPYRETTPEERKIFQALIDDTYEDFLKAIVAGRKMEMETLRPLADGRIYTGNQALKHKLVDRLGSHPDALKALKKMANLNDSASTRDYSKADFQDILNNLGAVAQKWSPSTQLEQLPEVQILRLNKVPLTLYY